MRLIVCRLIAATTLLASLTMAPLCASPEDRNINVTIEGARVDVDAIQRLYHGIYEAAGINTGEAWVAAAEGKRILRREKIVDTVDTPSANMPVGFRYYYYAGRDPKTEREIVWQSMKNVCVGAAACQPNDEFVAAYALAALDAYYVSGEPWRTLYASASDAASRLALGKVIAKAIDEAADQAKARGVADIASIRQRIVVGVSRNDAYATLRSLGVVAYNSAFNPGVPTESLTGYSGCNSSDQTAAAWPYHGEPLPKRLGECARMAPDDPGPFPSAYVTVSGAFTIACGSAAQVTLDFDSGDRIRKLTVGDFEWSCI